MSVSVIQSKVKDRTHKVCPGCHKLKPVDKFYINRISSDGRGVYCKKCKQEGGLTIKGRRYFGLHKRPFPLDGKCELCGEILITYSYHHWDNNNLNLGIWLCLGCDYLAEGLDEIDRNLWKVNTYHKLKEEVEEAEKVYIYLGPFSPPNGIRSLFLDGVQTHKWCPHCGKMKLVTEFPEQRSRYDGLFAWCRECWQIYQMRYHGRVIYGLHKRPNPDHCELCDIDKTRVVYHHWDDTNKSKGIWVCQTNMCHNLAEAVDLIDSNSLLSNKYYELKQEVILQEKNNA